MKRVIILSVLLLFGLISSQITPSLVGDYYEMIMHIVMISTMIALSYVMIHVGYEFEIDKTKVKSYGKDYLIAATTAAFPWLFVALYFVYYIGSEGQNPLTVWKESLLLARFAAPTSAGVLFSMLAVAGLGSTWMFRKARILAVFDDLDTVVFMIPLKIMIVGFHWELIFVVVILFVLLSMAWKYLHNFKFKISWNWVLLYAIVITFFSEAIYFLTELNNPDMPIHIEVLLPAFVLGCMIKRHKIKIDNRKMDILHTLKERKSAYMVSAIFMILVGLSMPAILGDREAIGQSKEKKEEIFAEYTNLKYYNDNFIDRADDITLEHTSALVVYSPLLSSPPSPLPSPVKSSMPWFIVLYHVLIVTLISNLGKMFPVLCYKNEASLKERLALSIAMFPRGEVGAGVILISLSYGISGPIITIAMLSLALNLIFTGFFIYIVKRLIKA
jgi:hypothetical protein